MCCDHGNPAITLSPAVAAASSSHTGGTVNNACIGVDPGPGHQPRSRA